ncbi:Os10g0427900 [Oryza sativa Japonica Group]|uniref:Expressed protein n=2 Tax=Oryza sativa subsp. japonica TaxID=39947 RepID=Q337Y4_ORYSJ|nr:expressed protein [Oryza sativa Japonica Group]BAF26566.1 Os10g0427900 [Oryza sativa Japonica Group]BAG89567.1 unnamed protein product [Oryza sativa Japonica Group]BAT10936.1 Os10g0427900 [Oryza sativa Japonica Group]|eukprot:NP_001064652.1 Os10g0427900 [Oryza sativa Japonica Group]
MSPPHQSPPPPPLLASSLLSSHPRESPPPHSLHPIPRCRQTSRPLLLSRARNPRRLAPPDSPMPLQSTAGPATPSSLLLPPPLSRVNARRSPSLDQRRRYRASTAGPPQSLRASS